MAFAGGDGSSGNPYQIATPAQLNDIRNYLGPSIGDNHFILINDIDLSYAPWTPIPGDYTNDSITFFGTLDGNGYTIRNLRINVSADYVGFFKVLRGHVHDLTFDDVEVTGNDYVGVLTGFLYRPSYGPENINITNASVDGKIGTGGITGWLTSTGSMSSCSFSGAVTGQYKVGGLIGTLDPPVGDTFIVEHCEMTGTVFQSGSTAGNVGGIVGDAANSGANPDSFIQIVNCINNADVQGYRYVGGIVGELNQYNVITRCHNTGNISTLDNNGSSVGGIVGSANNDSLVQCCYNEGDIAGGSGAGGIAGYADLIRNCYVAACTVSGYRGVGGLLGRGSVYIGYSRATVIQNQTAAQIAANPFLDMFEDTASAIGTLDGYAADVYCTGQVRLIDGTMATDRGFAGSFTAGSSLYPTRCFFDTDTSLQLSGIGATSKTTLELKTESTYSTFGNFLCNWAIDPLVNDGYPYLICAEQYTLTYGYNPIEAFFSGTTPQTVYGGGSGETVSVSPRPGYTFDGWSDGVLTASRQDTCVTSNITVTALFSPVITDHTLTYNDGPGGSISGTTPQTVPDGGDGTPVTAEADSGYRFYQWSDGSTDNPRQDTNVTGDITVTAQFIETHELVYTAGAGGSLTGATEQTVDDGGDGTPVTAVPEDDYAFDTWDDGSHDNPRQDTGVAADLSVQALFIRQYTLTYLAAEGGTISGTTPQTVDEGGDGSEVVAVPASNYEFVRWSDGVLTAARTDTGVTSDLTVTAIFKTDRIYVKADARGEETGLSWEDAFTDLQQGIDRAQALNVDEVLVAYGTYNPTSTHILPNSPQFKHFRLYNNLSIKGGYKGEGLVRDFNSYESKLSGKFSSYNSFHVVYLGEDYGLDSTAVLDGFTIEEGHALGAANFPNEYFGGGIFIDEGNEPDIKNCKITNNRAKSGAGIFLKALGELGRIVLDHEGDVIDDHLGFAIRDSDTLEGYPTFTDCVVEQNIAVNAGGGILFNNIYIPDNMFDGLVINNNKAMYGGGVAALNCSGNLKGFTGLSSATAGIVIKDNIATKSGGGLFIMNPVDLVITQMLIHNNAALINGGGVMISGGVNAGISKTVIYNNGAVLGGGAYLESGNFVLYQTHFIENKASRHGGGCYAIPYQIGMDRTTFYRNKTVGKSYSDKRGGGLFLKYGALNTTNTLFMENESEKGGGVFGELTWFNHLGVTFRDNVGSDGPDTYLLQSNCNLTGVIVKRTDEARYPFSINSSDLTADYLCYDEEAVFTNVTNSIVEDPQFHFEDLSLPWASTTMSVPVPGEPCRRAIPLSAFGNYIDDCLGEPRDYPDTAIGCCETWYLDP